MIDSINNEMMLFDENNPFFNQLNLFDDENILEFNKGCNFFQDQISNYECEIQMEKENEKNIETNLMLNLEENQSESVYFENKENLKNIICPSKQKDNIIISENSKSKTINNESEISEIQANLSEQNENKSIILKKKEKSFLKHDEESKKSFENESLKNKSSFHNIEKKIIKRKEFELPKTKPHTILHAEESEIKTTCDTNNKEAINNCIQNKKQNFVNKKLFLNILNHDENEVCQENKKDQINLQNKHENDELINLKINKRAKFSKEEISPNCFFKPYQKNAKIKPIEKTYNESNNPKSFYFGNVNLTSKFNKEKQEVELAKNSDDSLINKSKFFKSSFKNKEISYQLLNHEINKKIEEKQQNENITQKNIKNSKFFLKNKEPVINLKSKDKILEEKNEMAIQEENKVGYFFLN